MSEGTPLHGDRGAWDVINFEDEHARDIMDGTLRRHLPLPGAVGGYACSNGTDWVRVQGVPLDNLQDYAQGDLIYGGGAGWQDLAHPDAASHVLQSTVAEVGWSAQAVTFPAAGAVPIGTGGASQVAYWTGVNALAGDAGLTYNAGSLTAGDYFTGDGGQYGIPGNELLTVNAAGNFTFSGVTSIIVPDGAWVGADAACSWVFDSTNGYVTTLDKVGVGTPTPLYRTDIHVDIDTAYDPTAVVAGQVMRLANLGDGAGADAFTALQFHTSSQAGKNALGLINLIQPISALHGAEFAFQLRADGGAYNEVLRLTPTGVGVNRPDPQGLLHGYGSVSGFLHREFNDLAGVAQTVIPEGAGDVVRGTRIMYCIYVNTAMDFGAGEILIEPGQTVDLYNTGGDQFTASVAANGAVTVVRAAGADTADVGLWLIWL